MIGKVRIHDLRHAHASWLLAGGADLQVVKECLGHASIATTERYLHTLPTADDTALDALDKVRRGQSRLLSPGWLTAGECLLSAATQHPAVGGADPQPRTLTTLLSRYRGLGRGHAPLRRRWRARRRASDSSPARQVLSSQGQPDAHRLDDSRLITHPLEAPCPRPAEPCTAPHRVDGDRAADRSGRDLHCDDLSLSRWLGQGQGHPHVLLNSVDGTHQADLARFVANHPRSVLAPLVHRGSQNS